SVFRRHGRTFHNRKDVSLNSLARDIWASVGAFSTGNLVNLVDEKDARGFCSSQRLAGYPIHVHQLTGFFLRENFKRLRNFGFPLSSPVEARHALEKLLDVDADFLDSLTAEIA